MNQFFFPFLLRCLWRPTNIFKSEFFICDHTFCGFAPLIWLIIAYRCNHCQGCWCTTVDHAAHLNWNSGYNSLIPCFVTVQQVVWNFLFQCSQKVDFSRFSRFYIDMCYSNCKWPHYYSLRTSYMAATRS